MSTETDPLAPVLDRRAVLAGGALLVAAGAAAMRAPAPNKPPIANDAFKKMMPDVVGGWRFQQESGLVLPPEDALSARLYDNLVTRTYTNGAGQVMMLLIAYKNYQNGVLQIHRPEICYPAGGYRLSATEPTEISIGQGRVIQGNAFSANGTDRDEQVLYWTRIGDLFPVRWREQRIAVLRANLQRINPDGLLARVSMNGHDMAVSMPLMERFIADLRAASPAALRSILFGPMA